MTLRICHLYPDLLNLYGDRGNVMALTQRARWRGIEVTVAESLLGDRLDPARFDLYFIGGGEDRQQVLAARDLREVKAGALREAVAGGAALLAVCGGYQLLGHHYRPAEGDDLIGIGLLDLTTEHPGKDARRLIGNVVITSDLVPGGATLVGFENHGGRTRLGPGARPLGRVVVGWGNNGEDGSEGAVAGRVVGTYLHGPLLPKNPALTDLLLGWALARRGGPATLPPLDDGAERRAHASATARAGASR